MFIQWKNIYNVGVDIVDEQHKRLVAIINELQEAQQNGMAAAIMEEIYNRLVDYTVYHFSTEEQLFKDNNYPGADVHNNEHEEFVNKVHYLKYQSNEGNLLITLKTLDFLKDWLINHVLGDDQEFGAFMKDLELSKEELKEFSLQHYNDAG